MSDLVSDLIFAAEVLPGAWRGMTAFGMAVLEMRGHLCNQCRDRRAKGSCLHPTPVQVEAMADELDALVAAGAARRVDGERLGNGGLDSTIWYPA